MSTVRNIALVHGGFVDGSGWRVVYDLLCADGFTVRVVQIPTLSLAEDVATTRQVIEAFDGPVTLVGHSYGGVVITEVGTHEAVSSLAYIAAYVPDKAESIATLAADAPPGGSVPPILPPVDGTLYLDRESFPASFAADVPAQVAAFMADSQVPFGVNAFGGEVTAAAWRTKPASYLVTTQDQMIPPPAQRAMATRAGAHITETPASHAVFLSRPDVVAGVIAQAARG
jgi:pimeloyl-ACP methyl ester carboxylesterase